MAFSIQLSQEAEEDLVSIGFYIARNNPIRAKTFTHEILNEISKISHKPFLYPVIPEFKEKNIRKFIYQKYLIFYVVREPNIEVLRVIHGMRNYLKLI